MSWSLETLKELAQKQPSWVVEAEGDVVNVSNDEGVDAFIYVGNQQIVVETPLFPAASVTDQAALNDLILHSHHLLPLTSICISPIAGEDYYLAFGALSVDSKESVIVEEIETLLDNVGEFLDLYSDYLNVGDAA